MIFQKGYKYITKSVNVVKIQKEDFRFLGVYLKWVIWKSFEWNISI